MKIVFENTGGQRYSSRKMARLLVGAEFGRLSGYIGEDIEEKKTMEFVLEDDL